MAAVLEGLRLGAIWIVNGLLVLGYLLADRALALALAPPLAWLAATGPAEQRRPALAVAGLALAAALFAPAPVPALLLAMAWAGAAAVRYDRFSPNTLRWRVSAGLGLEALAALGLTLAWLYLNRLTPAAFGALLAAGEAGALLGQGRAVLNTLAVLGTWIGIPGAFFSLLAQGLLVHAPLGDTPAALIHRVRGRGRDT